jgi:hypothetical protein
VVNPMRTTATAAQTGMMFWNSSTGEVQSITTSKTFVIDHPVDPEKYLVHACLEGPESGVYYRGKNSVNRSTKISLPNYVSKLAKDFTIHLTPIGTFAELYASDVDQFGEFIVYSNKFCKFHWAVYGTRGSINTEPLKSECDVQGSGPYKWIKK